MKKILLICLALMISHGAIAQKVHLKDGLFIKNVKKEQKVAAEPAEKTTASLITAKPRALKRGYNAGNIVTILNLGTSANVVGYSSGTRTMVWADDDLNCVINFHRAGPGSSPPSLSGYLAMDLGVNLGAQQTDWTNQIICSNAIMEASPYYYDASRYPAAAIYNPQGNTTLENAYCAFFAPNFANPVWSGFGGYTYGTANLVNHADTNKNIRWWDGHPPTYLPT
jgi:hypothetical protein